MSINYYSYYYFATGSCFDVDDFAKRQLVDWAFEVAPLVVPVGHCVAALPFVGYADAPAASMCFGFEPASTDLDFAPACTYWGSAPA